MTDHEWIMLGERLSKQDGALARIEMKVDHFHTCVEGVKSDIKGVRMAARITSTIVGAALAIGGIWVKFKGN